MQCAMSNAQCTMTNEGWQAVRDSSFEAGESQSGKDVDKRQQSDRAQVARRNAVGGQGAGQEHDREKSEEKDAGCKMQGTG